MGDNISLFDSMLITVFSMFVVFVVLILIAYLINLLKIMSNNNKTEKRGEKPKVLAKAPESVVINDQEQEQRMEQNDEELVAVIAAAVAASMGLNIPDIKIKTIRRIPQNSHAWSEMGRKEQMLGKL